MASVGRRRVAKAPGLTSRSGRIIYARRPNLDRSTNDSLHGQGRCRQDLRRGRDRPPVRGSRAAHRRALDRPRPQPLRLARGADLGADPTPIGERLWGQEVQAQREMEDNWGQVQHWLAGLLADRGVMDIAAEELTVPAGHGRAVQPAADQAPPRLGRLRRGDRGLRADGRDPAAALVPRDRAVVAGEGVPGRAQDGDGRAPDREDLPRRRAARPGRLRRGQPPRRATWWR